MDTSPEADSPLRLLAAAIHAVTAGTRQPADAPATPAPDLRTGTELLGWAAERHPSFLVHLTDEQLDAVACVLDGMLRERAQHDPPR